MDSTTNLNEAARQVRSRRALMVGALGGLGAWATSAVGRRVSPAGAAAGDPILMGQANDAAGTNTQLETNSSGTAFTVRQNGGLGVAIRAESAAPINTLRAVNNGIGVAISASSTGGTAIVAESGPGSSFVSGSAIYAHSSEHTAIEASSGGFPQQSPPAPLGARPSRLHPPTAVRSSVLQTRGLRSSVLLSRSTACRANRRTVRACTRSRRTATAWSPVIGPGPAGQAGSTATF